MRAKPGRPASGGVIARRAVLKGLRAGGALALAAPLLNLGRSRVLAASAREYSHRAIDLVGRSLVIDMLGLLSVNDEVRERWLGGSGMTSSERDVFRRCGITAFHNSVGIGGLHAHEVVLEYIAGLNGFVARNGDGFIRIERAGDLDRAKRSKKTGVIIGVQNAEQFRAPEDVRTFHALGMRCAQLTYNQQNRLGSGATERVDGGVSDFGAAIIGSMNEAGMLVDVSHSGDRTTLDAIEISRRPIAITHSNCRALNEHPRLKTDEAIRKLAARGGVIGIAGLRMFVRGTEPTTLEHIADHIDHVVKLVGIEHVGIGSDADLWGYDSLPPAQLAELRRGYKASYAFRERIDIEGFDHPRKVFDLTETLIRRGYGDADIAAVLGGNFRRLLGQVWGE